MNGAICNTSDASQEEIELYSHILAGLKPLVQGRLDAEATVSSDKVDALIWKFLA